MRPQPAAWPGRALGGPCSAVAKPSHVGGLLLSVWLERTGAEVQSCRRRAVTGRSPAADLQENAFPAEHMDMLRRLRSGRLSGARRQEGSLVPRLTRSVFWDLAVWMIGLGLLAGLSFPPFVLLLGLQSDQVLTVPFFLATMLAGLLVGGANFALSRAVVGRRLRMGTTV